MPQAQADTDYRYAHFRLRHMLADMRFDPDSPRPGDPLPAVSLRTVDGHTIDPDALDRPHLFVFGSGTCPMTAAAAGPLQRLHAEFGEDVRFVLVQVRQAHPGERLDQAATDHDKAEQARRLRDALDLEVTVAVDDVDGTFHTALDPKPNAAYLVDAAGIIRFRSIWASDERGLREALGAVTAGRSPRRDQSTRMVAPMMASLGHIDAALRAGGPRASRDLARSAPPMLLGGRLASVFGNVAPERRGLAVVVTTGLVALLAVGLAIGLT